MKKLKIAMPPGFDKAVVDLVLRRYLRVVTGEEYEVEYEVTFDHGGFALTGFSDSESDSEFDRTQIDSVVKSLAPAMEILERSDPEGGLQLLSSELKKDRAETEAEIERLTSGMEREEHSR